MSLLIEPSKESSTRTDEGLLRTVWGYVYAEDEPRAVYYVRWNDSLLEEALFVVAVGLWGDDSSDEDRTCVAALARADGEPMSFMLIDADKTSFSEQAFLGKKPAAAEVRGTDLATEAFHILDHIVAEDPRVRDLRSRLEAAG